MIHFQNTGTGLMTARVFVVVVVVVCFVSSYESLRFKVRVKPLQSL